MTRALLDSGFLYAIADADDARHNDVIDFIRTGRASLVLPVSVLPEVSYLLYSRLGHLKMRHFLRDLVSWPMQVETLGKDDLERVIQILEQYADAELDFVDASIIAIAERLNITRVLTLDRRDFSIVRPRHCDYFELLP
jgi:uncharacterized protein